MSFGDAGAARRAGQPRRQGHFVIPAGGVARHDDASTWRSTSPASPLSGTFELALNTGSADASTASHRASRSAAPRVTLQIAGQKLTGSFTVEKSRPPATSRWPSTCSSCWATAPRPTSPPDVDGALLITRQGVAGDFTAGLTLGAAVRRQDQLQQARARSWSTTAHRSVATLRQRLGGDARTTSPSTPAGPYFRVQLDDHARPGPDHGDGPEARGRLRLRAGHHRRRHQGRQDRASATSASSSGTPGRTAALDDDDLGVTLANGNGAIVMTAGGHRRRDLRRHRAHGRRCSPDPRLVLRPPQAAAQQHRTAPVNEVVRSTASPPRRPPTAPRARRRGPAVVVVSRPGTLHARLRHQRRRHASQAAEITAPLAWNATAAPGPDRASQALGPAPSTSWSPAAPAPTPSPGAATATVAQVARQRPSLTLAAGPFLRVTAWRPTLTDRAASPSRPT